MQQDARNRRALVATVLHTPAKGTTARLLAAVRWLAAIIFVSFGVTKFTDHAAEVASFRDYPLPEPEFFVYLVGVAETGGAILLALGLLTRLAALALAGDMIGAIAVSGAARGELISLTLAPLLLIAMIVLIRYGGGSWSADTSLTRRLSRNGHQASQAAEGARAASDHRRPTPLLSTID